MWVFNFLFQWYCLKLVSRNKHCFCKWVFTNKQKHFFFTDKYYFVKIIAALEKRGYMTQTHTPWKICIKTAALFHSKAVNLQYRFLHSLYFSVFFQPYYHQTRKTISMKKKQKNFRVEFPSCYCFSALARHTKHSCCQGHWT